MNYLNRIANKKLTSLFQVNLSVEKFSRKFSLQQILNSEKKENINIGTIGEFQLKVYKLNCLAHIKLFTIFIRPHRSR
jgi:hypothetical protein